MIFVVQIASQVVNGNSWVHIALTIEPKVVNLYVDGVMTAQSRYSNRAGGFADGVRGGSGGFRQQSGRTLPGGDRGDTLLTRDDFVGVSLQYAPRGTEIIVGGAGSEPYRWWKGA